MATKDQERKALEKIRKIVEGLGEESYIGKAFEGCFEMAKQNIDSDFWNSWKDKYELQVKATESEAKMADTQRKQVLELKNDLEKAKNAIKSAEEREIRTEERCRDASKTATEYWNNCREKDAKIEDLELEIMKLKAKLYDMIVNQGE